jgi:hypothetical protein
LHLRRQYPPQYVASRHDLRRRPLGCGPLRRDGLDDIDLRGVTVGPYARERPRKLLGTGCAVR